MSDYKYAFSMSVELKETFLSLFKWKILVSCVCVLDLKAYIYLQ